MFNKTFYFIICCVTPLIFAKTDYLPPLGIIDNVVSKEVSDFINENEDNSQNIVALKSSNYDVLGRRFPSNQPTNYVILPEKTMDVDVAFRGNRKKSPQISGRYEFSNLGKAYWFNGKKVSEKEYLNLFNESLDTTFLNHGFTARLTANEIKELLHGNRKVFIDKAKDISNENYVNYDIIFNYSQISTHAHSNGYEGNSIGVYFDESGYPNASNINTAYYTQASHCIDGDELWHATGVATILQKTAPKATIYGFCKKDTIPNPYNYNPNIEIGSHSWSTAPNNQYSPQDHRYDAYVFDDKVINFFAAGNQDIIGSDFNVRSPAIAPNVIAVGAVSPTNHRYKLYSRHVNPILENQKPEVANYAEFIFPDATKFTDINGRKWTGYFDKTSAATPYTAGITADLLSHHPFFKKHPELVKAHFLASEKIPIIDPESHDEDNLTAAKGIVTYSSLAWNHRLRYWNDVNSCCFDSNNTITFAESDIRSNSHYRIAISWLTNPDYILNHNTLSQDIDLRVYQNGMLLAASISSTDPFEIVDFTTVSNTDLVIEITRYANSGDDDVIMGYSFWNDI